MNIWLFRILSGFILTLIFLLGVGCFFLHNHSIDFSRLQQDMGGKPSVLLDAQGQVWGMFQFDKRKYVSLEMMPEYVIQAFLVTEDRDFFKHPGISFRGILRSIIVNLGQGKKVQGASTITQQLVKLVFFHNAKTFSRKIKEQFYAILVERRCSKEQILESYLNNVYFGYGIYGVQAAAQRFWGKDIADVSIEQAAVLASVMRSPKFYSPIHAPDAVFKRRNMILKMMRELQVISLIEYQHAIKQELNIQDPDNATIAPHLKETIRVFLESLVGREMLYSGGLMIQTTLNMQQQQVCQEVFKNHINVLKKTLHEDIDGGAICMDSTTGEIRVMIGGIDFQKSKFNRAMQAYRQMGSVFKVFVYAAALAKGYKFSDVEVDEPIELVQNGVVWKPKNHNNKFLGNMTRAYALSHSNNMVAIKTLLQAGPSDVIDIAKRCRISTSMNPYPSLALGCVDVNVLEVVGAFNVMVNHGKYIQPHFLRWVKNSMGEKIYKCTVDKNQVIEPWIASQITKVLTLGMERLKSKIGTQWFGGDAAGKTGTTNDSRTCWFCGATPDLTMAMYVGTDHNESLGDNVYSSQAAFPIWFQFHEKIENKTNSFYYDPGLKEYRINWRTGRFSSALDDEDVVTLLQ